GMSPDAEPLDLSPAVARGSSRLPTHLGNELSRRIGRSGATAHLAERADAHPESGGDSRRGIAPRRDPSGDGEIAKRRIARTLKPARLPMASAEVDLEPGRR